MTDRDVIERVARLWDASVRHRTYSHGRGAAWMTRLRDGKAADLMLLLQPFMSERRQAQIGKALASYHPQKKRRSSLPATVL